MDTPAKSKYPVITIMFVIIALGIFVYYAFIKGYKQRAEAKSTAQKVAAFTNYAENVANNPEISVEDRPRV